jgi:hypothetical protein
MQHPEAVTSKVEIDEIGNVRIVLNDDDGAVLACSRS